jgi:hypothetical protein
MSARPSKQFQGMCVERYSHQLHKDLKDPTAFKSLKAIFQQNAIWKKGSTGNITVTFGSQKCNGCDINSSWSLIGSECNSSNPSTNLGFIDSPFENFTYNGKTYPYSDFKDATRNWCSDQRNDCDPAWQPGATVLHEFGHALGMLHEHQNNLFNSNTIKLNKNAVIEYYNSIGLGEEGAYTNMLEVYDCSKNKGLCDYDGSKFDQDSIMLYHLPDDLVIGTNPTKGNFKYSKLDKEWLAKKYPMSVTASEQPFLTVKFLDKNEKPWKQAWVTKMVTDYLAPLVGVRFRFAWTDGTNIDYRPIETPVPTITIKKAEPTIVTPIPTPDTHMIAYPATVKMQKLVDGPGIQSLDITVKSAGATHELPSAQSAAPVPMPATSSVAMAEIKETFSGSMNDYNYVPMYILCFLLFLLSIKLMMI